MSALVRRRRLAVAAITLALALPTAATTLVASPARSADPVEDCVDAFPVEDIVAGDAVDGLTVVRGTTPTTFTGEVLGVLEDGIAPDVDMVMVDIAMPEMARTGGIWQGMSGSPVYAGDGRLIGAVAYGLSNGPSPIAGVTPYADMDDYLAGADAGTPTGRVPLTSADARTIATRAGISPAEAARGFRELPMPVGITGVTSRRLAQLQSKDSTFAQKDSYVLGRAAAADAGAETMVAGGNMAASLSFGDITMAGVGTVTSVCAGRVVGFGHPMAFLGSSTLGLHPADAVYVQPDSLGAPFKVANIGPAVGTVTDDRITGITGTFGAVPSAITVTSEVTYGPRSRTGTTHVLVPLAAAEATFYQMIANQDRVVDGPSTGTEVLTWTITGTDGAKPFRLTYTDRVTGHHLAEEQAYGVADLVDTLASLDGVALTSVTARAALTDDLRRNTIKAVQQYRGGQWVRVTRKAPAQARAGATVRLRVALGGTAGRQLVTLKPFTLSKRASGPLVLLAQGGDSSYSEYYYADSVGQLRGSLAKQLRRDQVRVQVGTPDKIDLGFPDEFEFRSSSRRFSFLRTMTSAPRTHVVGGERTLRLIVR